VTAFVVVHGDSARRAAEIQADPSWQYFEIETGHNLHDTAPEQTVEILFRLANE